MKIGRKSTGYLAVGGNLQDGFYRVLGLRVLGLRVLRLRVLRLIDGFHSAMKASLGEESLDRLADLDLPCPANHPAVGVTDNGIAPAKGVQGADRVEGTAEGREASGVTLQAESRSVLQAL
jgi:hypothetical protein